MRQTLKGIEAQKMRPKPDQDIFLNKKIVAPQKLKILVLSGNDIVNDELQFINKCVNLLKLDLSHNHITKISSKVKMNELKKLKILYMHNNRIQNIQGLEKAFSVPELVHFTIKGNPIENVPRIEHMIVNMVPTLKILGERVIFVEERSADVFDARQNVFIEPELAEGWKSRDNQESHYIKILQLQLRYFENVWYFSNPIIKIQRFWKQRCKQLQQSKIIKRKMRRSPQKFNDEQNKDYPLLVKFFSQWKQFARKRRAIKQALDTNKDELNNKIFLTFPYKEYLLSRRNFKINSIIRKYIEYIRQKIFLRKMADKVARQLRKKKYQFNSYESFFEVAGIHKSNKFYFSKIQNHLLENFLAHITKNFHWEDKVKANTKVGTVTKYLSIRVVDPETYTVKRIYSVFTYFIWPSMKVIFLKKKKAESTQKTGLIKIKPLYYIKNKNKRVTADEAKKSNRVYRKLEKFYRKQYQNSLDYFQCTDPELMKMLLRYIYYHNSKTMVLPKILEKNQMQSLLQSYDEPFLIYAQDIVKRTAAAVRIQQNWRKYLVHKKQSDSIYAKMKATRAVYRIQRFWRDQVFYHRLSFHKMITHELRLFVGSSFLIPTEIYNRISQICELSNKIALYDDLHILIDRESHNFYAIWHYQNAVVPKHIQEIFFPNHEQLNIENLPKCAHADVYQILHYKSAVIKKQYNSKNYFEFTFKSVEECRFRIYLIAMLSYKIYGSLMFLPLSKETLDLEDTRYKIYAKLHPDLSNMFSAKLSSTKNNPPREEKGNFKILKYFESQGLFFYSSSQAHVPSQKAKPFEVELEFYQKMFRDFPKKFIDTFKYMIVQKKQEDANHHFKEETIEDLIEKNQVRAEDFVKMSPPKKMSLLEKQETNPFEGFNISKIDRKKLSMYEVGSKTGMNFRQEKSFINQMRQFANTTEISERKNNISQIKVEEKAKKEQKNEKKKADLIEKKEQIRKQRDFSNNIRNMKELQRTEMIRRKVQKVKSFKNRLSHSKRKDSEEDFIQQGNFVMEQQLKMVIMKSKISNISHKPTFKDRSETVSRKQRSFFVNSQMSELEKEQKISEQIKSQTMPLRLPESYGTTVHEDQGFEGGERKIVNVRNLNRKNRTQSIGAYLRDPSYVHGVFPEEYYPISTKGATFKFFPPL